MNYLVELTIIVAIWTILAASFNIIIGYAGLFVVAHPLFFACGAYGSILFATMLGLPFAACALAAAILAIVLSLAFSLPTVRVSGDYLLIASAGFLLGSLQVIRNADWLGASSGLSGPAVFAAPGRAFWGLLTCGLCAVAMLFLARWLVGSHFGRAVIAMRDDETALASLGRNPIKIKMLLIAVGAACASVAGSLYAGYFQYVSPDQFEMMAATTMLAMVMVGGIGSTFGPFAGAIIMTAVPQLVTFFDMRPAWLAPVQGMIFTGIVILFLFLRPQGLFGSSTRIGQSNVDAQ